MRYSLVLIIISAFLFTSNLASQVIPDSVFLLIDTSRLTYSGKVEKSQFENYLKGRDTKWFDIALSFNSNLTLEMIDQYRNELTNFVTQLGNSSNMQKSNKKKIKYIYNEVHGKYLEKYVERSFFKDMFRNGEYNCVSASILFSFVFNHLNIPFAIKNSINHVYIVAYPGYDDIIVETTNPQVGYFSYNERFKDNYVGYLLESKQISETEYKNNSVHDLFDKYFFKNKDISFIELIGVQYNNQGLIKLEEKKYAASSDLFDKGYLLYQTVELQYVNFISIAAYLESSDYSMEYIDFLVKASKYKNLGVTKDQIFNEFIDITTKVLNYNSNIVLYEELYEGLISSLDDEEIKKDVKFVYNYEKGRRALVKSDHNQAFKYYKEAYLLKPENIDAERGFVTAIALKIENSNNSMGIYNELDMIEIKHENIGLNKSFRQMKSFAILAVVTENAYLKNIDLALLYLEKFEEYIGDEVIDPTLYRAVEDAYSGVAMYYFRKGQYSRAREKLKKGLVYHPGSYGLRARLDALND